MVECRVSITSPLYNNIAGYQCKLIVEIGINHLAFVVEDDKKVIGFEYYAIAVENDNWNNVFAGAKNFSKLFSKNFGAVQIVYNTPEALIIPAQKFSNNSTDSYLQTVFGEQKNLKTFVEKVNIQHQPSLIANINDNIQLAVQSNFGNHYNSHVYTAILQQILGKETMVLEMLKVQFYNGFMVVLVVNNNALSLVQSFNYTTPEDVVYYLLNIVEQFSLSLNNTPVEVSGIIETSSKTFELLEHLFTRLTLETVNMEKNNGFEEAITVSNAHYYTPFFNLVQ
jgi:hypothetical protein